MRIVLEDRLNIFGRKSGDTATEKMDCTDVKVDSSWMEREPVSAWRNEKRDPRVDAEWDDKVLTGKVSWKRTLWRLMPCNAL